MGHGVVQPPAGVLGENPNVTFQRPGPAIGASGAAITVDTVSLSSMLSERDEVIRQLTQDLKICNDKLHTAEVVYNTYLGESKTKITNLENTIQQAVREKEQYSMMGGTQLSEAANQINALTNQLTACIAENANLSAQQQAMQVEGTRLVAENQALTNQINNLQINLENLNNANSNLQKALNDLGLEGHQAVDRLRLECQQEVDRLRLECQREVDRLGNENRALVAELSVAKASSGPPVFSISGHDNQTMQTQIDLLNQDLVVRGSRIVTLEGNLHNYGIEIKRLYTDNTNLKTTTGQLQNEIESCKKELSTLRDTLAKAQQDLSNATMSEENKRFVNNLHLRFWDLHKRVTGLIENEHTSQTTGSINMAADVMLAKYQQLSNRPDCTELQRAFSELQNENIRLKSEQIRGIRSGDYGAPDLSGIKVEIDRALRTAEQSCYSRSMELQKQINNLDVSMNRRLAVLEATRPYHDTVPNRRPVVSEKPGMAEALVATVTDQIGELASTIKALADNRHPFASAAAQTQTTQTPSGPPPPDRIITEHNPSQIQMMPAFSHPNSIPVCMDPCPPPCVPTGVAYPPPYGPSGRAPDQ